jgi:hypothetical protein
MKGLFRVATATTVLGISGGIAVAANLNPSQLGASCPAGFIGTYHFVNNQTGGAGGGTLTATWDSGNSCVTGPYSILNNTQHFQCTALGALTSASTDLPGRLVLSDFSCGDVKNPPPPPPPCDPKKEECPK